MDETMVDRYHPMDPKTEMYVPIGEDLQNGMIVLIRDTRSRWELSELKDTPGDIASAMMTNRWCEVSNVEVSGGFVEFTGFYADGSKARRKYETYCGWVAKRNWLPRPPIAAKEVPVWPGINVDQNNRDLKAHHDGATETYEKPKPLDEARIRQIIREELKSLLVSLAFNSREMSVSGDLDSAEDLPLSLISKVMDGEAKLIPHSWVCSKRDLRTTNNDCDCGVGE